MNEEQLVTHQKQYFHDLYSRYDLYEKGSWLEKPSPFIQRYIPVIQRVPDSRVLDLGAGPGRHALSIAGAAASANTEVTAVDHLPLAVEQLETNSRRFGVEANIRPMHDKAENVTIQEQYYHWILAVHLLEHIPSPEQRELLLSRIEAGVVYKRYVTIVMNTDQSEDTLPEPAWNPAAEEASKVLRKAFASWRVAAEKIDKQTGYNTLTFLAQKE
ncbi:class I SAM-dependent methyltransferase [Salibacterium lacus]|uniref:Class I SAM-dependent methyltransferase n=1 Tax=Salibacterium lacus TaxID=1898109 RepID=A0ABW5SZP9_9BACI